MCRLYIRSFGSRFWLCNAGLESPLVLQGSHGFCKLIRLGIFFSEIGLSILLYCIPEKNNHKILFHQLESSSCTPPLNTANLRLQSCLPYLCSICLQTIIKHYTRPWQRLEKKRKYYCTAILSSPSFLTPAPGPHIFNSSDCPTIVMLLHVWWRL